MVNWWMDRFVSRLSGFSYFVVDFQGAHNIAYVLIDFETSMLVSARSAFEGVECRVRLLSFSSGHYFSHSAHVAEHVCDVQRAPHVARGPDSSAKSIVMLMISCVGFRTLRARSFVTAVGHCVTLSANSWRDSGSVLLRLSVGLGS